ncbi:MAG: hypothetical protein OCD01_10740 [Fibrobacterales bacterium]
MYILFIVSMTALCCICCSDYDGSALSNSIHPSSQEQTFEPPKPQ